MFLQKKNTFNLARSCNTYNNTIDNEIFRVPVSASMFKFFVISFANKPVSHLLEMKIYILSLAYFVRYSGVVRTLSNV